ncbi:Succinyl-CoA:(R)-benzylsuccinate CoA-transferase subunit BbsF [bacterium HR23]|nr:Succinyl-CoA:(R)-benzylsuccinate CoA-transferase subunit BbsF [bacterium HR23]
MRPLEGIHVLDFTWVGVGPLFTRYLADFGAEVIKVESSTRPDSLRRGGPFKDNKPGLNRSGYFANYNCNKRSIAINMATPKGRDLARRLVPWADVVTENFTAGQMEEWGLGYNDLRRIKPDIILVSACMFGRGGPYSSHPGFGPMLTTLTGFTYLTGWPDRDPVPPYGAYTDFFVPRFLVLFLLSALDLRRRTGQGMHLDMSQLEAGIHLLAPVFLDYFANGRVMERRGNRDTSAVPHGVYPCRGEDRWVAIACFRPPHWEGLKKAMEHPSWADDPRFATFLGRKAHEAELDTYITRWTQQFTQPEVVERLQRCGVPSAPVHDLPGVFSDPNLRERGHWVRLEHPEIGPHHYDGVEFRMSASPPRFEHPAPLLGQHTREALHAILGMPDEEIDALEKEGVLQ